MELRFNAPRPDASYLASINLFFAALFALAIFQQGWPEEKLGSQSVLQKCADWFRQMFEGGLTGNRLNIAARIAARADLDLRIEKILHYVWVMADESDIEKLVNTGVVTRKTRKKARRISRPAVAN